jgi:uncharacterized protein
MTSFKLQASTLRIEDATSSFVVGAGDPFVTEIRKGQIVRIVDLEGNQSADTMFFNARDYSDRYNSEPGCCRPKAIFC